MARRGSNTATTPRSVERADQPAGGLGQERGGPRQVDSAEGVGAGPLAAGLQQRLVGAGEREAVDGDEAEGGPGHVDALEQPGGGEQAARLVARRRCASSAGLGRSFWVRTR